MGVQTTRPRIVAICKTITGVFHVYDNIPRVVLPAFLPAVVVFTGEVTSSQSSDGNNPGDVFGDQANLDTRIYRITLLVEEARMNAEGEAEISTDPFFDRFREAFQAKPGLELDTDNVAVYGTRWLGDNGFRLIPYPKGSKEIGEFAGTEFRLEVQEVTEVNYED